MAGVVWFEHAVLSIFCPREGWRARANEGLQWSSSIPGIPTSQDCPSRFTPDISRRAGGQIVDVVVCALQP